MSSFLTRRALGGLALAATATALTGRRAAAQDALSIATVNYPLAYFAQRIGGAQAAVNFPVPEGIDPSFWRPGIADISAFQSADLILLNGASFADWTARTTLPRSRIVQTSAAFESDYITTASITHAHGEGGEHSHTGIASYVWLDFTLAQQQAEAIATAMIRRAPEAEGEIAANLEALAMDLNGLDATAREIGAAAEGIAMIAAHPRYQYLAHAYGLTIDALEWDATGPVSEEQWTALEALVAETGARVFIWEAAPDADAMVRIEALGLANTVFPPLANRPADGDFLNTMSGSLEALRGAIQIAADG